MAHYNAYPCPNFDLNMSTQNHDSFKELYEARHEPENLRPIAEAYWRTILVLFVVATGLVIFFGVWQFSSVISTMSSASDTATAQQKPAINKEELEALLAKFDERRANYDLAKTVFPVVVDPSK